jgi:predicted nucleotidyltransferase
MNILDSTGRTRPSIALQNYRAQIRHVVLAHRATNARVFGSVLRGEDTEASDLDLLVDPTPETSLMDIGAIRHELKALLGVNVDVLTPKALPEAFRDQVLREAEPV